MDSQEPVIETVVATVAEIDPNELIVGYKEARNEGTKSTLDVVIDASKVTANVVALGATKAAGVAVPAIAKGVEKAAPVVEKGAKYTAKGAVKLTTIGLQALGKGLSSLGNRLKASGDESEEPQNAIAPADDMPEEAIGLLEDGIGAEGEEPATATPDPE